MFDFADVNTVLSALTEALSLRILGLFGEMRKDRLDLHALSEAVGNEPDERRRVLDSVDELIRPGMLGDFYMLTERGKSRSRKPE